MLIVALFQNLLKVSNSASKRIEENFDRLIKNQMITFFLYS